MVADSSLNSPTHHVRLARLSKMPVPGPAILRSKDPLLPFEWHSLQVERRLRDAKMILDGKDVVRGRAPGSTRGLNIRTHVYLGGFDGE